MLAALNDPLFWMLLAIWPASGLLRLILLVCWIKQYL
jgi:hypothetical protein